MPKNAMFAEFHSSDEYKNAYQSILDKLPKENHFEFIVFTERLRTTMLMGIEPITKTQRSK